MNGSVWKYPIGTLISTIIAIKIAIIVDRMDRFDIAFDDILGNIFIFGGIAIAMAVVIAVEISSRRKKFLEAQRSETDWVEKALDFYCNNAQLAPGQVFAKYKWYLSMISRFLTKYPRHKNFRNDLKSVFEMSQNDSRLTPKDKQEITNKFTSTYKFLLLEKQAI
jgi:hypothetical protein